MSRTREWSWKIAGSLLVTMVAAAPAQAQVWQHYDEVSAQPPAAGDEFGTCTAVFGDRVVVGAWMDGNSGPGYAEVYKRSLNGWDFEQRLVTSNGASKDQFGYWVAGDGDTILVGAPGANAGTGAAYVFHLVGGTWNEQPILVPPTPVSSAYFGNSVTVDGDTIVVGEYFGNSGNGLAHVFTRSAGTWGLLETLASGSTSSNEHFGASVDIEDHKLIIGAYNDGGNAQGAAYVFTWNGSSWANPIQLLPPSQQNHAYFGISVSIEGDTVVIGEHNRSVNNTAGAGMAHVFEFGGSSWTPVASLTASNGAQEDYFGFSVDISGSTVAVGALHNISPGLNPGHAYVFEKPTAGWPAAMTENRELSTTALAGGDCFGRFVSIEGDVVAVGAYHHNPGGLNNAGSVFIFEDAPGHGFCFGEPGYDTPCPCGNDNDGSVPGSGCANGVFASGAHLIGSGLASISSDSLVLSCTGLQPDNFGLYFQANNDLSPGLLWGDGLQCAGANLLRLELQKSDSTGASHTTIGISAKAGGIAAGETKYYQCWYRNPANSPCGFDFNSSNGYAIRWLP